MAAVKPIRAPAVAPRDAVAQPLRPVIVIGSRWTPDYAIRLDRAAGVFEEVNSQMLRESERLVQRATLAPVINPESLQRIEAARVARSPKVARAVEYRVVTNGASQ